MKRAEEFEGLRPLLLSIAYRILGTLTEAEDAGASRMLRMLEVGHDRTLDLRALGASSFIGETDPSRVRGSVP